MGCLKLTVWEKEEVQLRVVYRKDTSKMLTQRGNTSATTSLTRTVGASATAATTILPQTINSVQSANLYNTSNYYNNPPGNSVQNLPNLYNASNGCPTCPKIDIWNGDRGFWGNLNASSNPLKKFVYNYANSGYLTAQGVFPSIGLDYTNPLTGEKAFTNLDDTPQYDASERIFAASSIAMPYLPLSKAKLSLVKMPKTLNASQFSRTFKAMRVNKLKSSTRGLINRYYNKAIRYFNEKINTNDTFIKISNGISKLLSQ